MTVAVLALVVALGGSAYAVSRINGTSIRPRSIPADRVRRNALTGTEINEAKLGRVNEARNATNSKFALRAAAADSAANALSAGNALTAGSAGNASTLGGSPAGAFQGRIRWALVSQTGSVLDQSGGIGPVAHTGNTYVVDFGASLAGRALVVTPNASAAPVAAAPCGGALPGAAICTSGNDANHAQVTIGSGSGGPFYIAAIG
jgi:hypothetical protein